MGILKCKVILGIVKYSRRINLCHTTATQKQIFKTLAMNNLKAGITA